MKLSAILLLPFAAVAVARSYGDNTYRCNGRYSETEDTKTTLNCCDSLSQNTCDCFNTKLYCTVDGDNIEKFKECCGNSQGDEVTEC